MKIRILIALMTTIALAAPASATWSLVWSDEFNGTSLNTTDWNYDFGNGCPDLCGWGNNELQYYRSQNVTVSGGNLVITAKAENYAGYQFTSGKIHTRNKQSFLYGRMEMRAKLPTGGGMWPAFWMMPQDDAYGGWAASGEIDIMESINDADSVAGTIHYGGSWPANVHSGGTYAPGVDYSADFHTFAVEWEPDEIRWYVDDVLYSTRTSAQWYSANAPENPRAPFDQPFYIILNAAVGGNYPGCTSPSCISADLPQEYVVDYVRVYQDIPNLAPTVEITAPQSGANPPAGDITIEAIASDADGTIQTVEFYLDGALLGSDTTTPYTWLWSGAADGCYTVTVRALDDLGAEATDGVDVTVGAGCGQASYLGSPTLLPARVQAENFDVGGNGVAYADATAGNSGNQYRTDEDVDIENCSDVSGGYNVGWVTPGEWLEFTVDVPAAGQYPIDVRVASQSTGGTFRIEFDGADATGEVTFGSTGGWQNWTTASTTAMVAPGVQVMRLVLIDGEFNVNWMHVWASVTSVEPELPAGAWTLHPCFPNPFNPSTTIAFDAPRAGAYSLVVHDVAGRAVRTLAAGETVEAGRHEIVWNGRDDAGRTVPAGVYYGRLVAAGQATTVRMALLK